MTILAFSVINPGDRFTDPLNPFGPIYTKLSNAQSVDIASGMPEGNAAPYNGFRHDHPIVLITSSEAISLEEKYNTYRIGNAVKNYVQLFDNQVYLKANLLKVDISPFSPFK